MAGHSKWAQIKRKKAANDAKRGAHFTKLIREITVAAKQGGGDPEGNPRLRTAIAIAKAANMPNDNISRAIKKGTGELAGVVYEEVMYEGYGPGGAAIMIEATTDNINRTVAEIRHVFSKRGGNLGTSGSVAWVFEKKGQILIRTDRHDEDTVMEAALDASSEDFDNEGEYYVVTTGATQLHQVLDALEQHGISAAEAQLTMIPTNTVTVEGTEATRLLGLMETLDELDDVSRIYSNFDIDSETLAAVGD